MDKFISNRGSTIVPDNHYFHHRPAERSRLGNGHRGKICTYPTGVSGKQNKLHMPHKKSDKMVVIFGDSQWRPVVEEEVKLPCTNLLGFGVNCTPGATFRHIHLEIKEMKLPDETVMVMFSVGTNNLSQRFRNFERDMHDFKRMLDCASEMFGSVKISVMEIPQRLDEYGVLVFHYNNEMRKVCKERDIPFISLDSIRDVDDDLFCYDGVHLSLEGMQIVSEVVVHAACKTIMSQKVDRPSIAKEDNRARAQQKSSNSLPPRKYASIVSKRTVSNAKGYDNINKTVRWKKTDSMHTLTKGSYFFTKVGPEMHTQVVEIRPFHAGIYKKSVSKNRSSEEEATGKRECEHRNQSGRTKKRDKEKLVAQSFNDAENIKTGSRKMRKTKQMARNVVECLDYEGTNINDERTRDRERRKLQGESDCREPARLRHGTGGGPIKLKPSKDIHCICRTRFEGKNRRSMIQCDECDEWYHNDCALMDEYTQEERENMTYRCGYKGCNGGKQSIVMHVQPSDCQSSLKSRKKRKIGSQVDFGSQSENVEADLINDEGVNSLDLEVDETLDKNADLTTNGPEGTTFPGELCFKSEPYHSKGAKRHDSTMEKSDNKPSTESGQRLDEKVDACINLTNENDKIMQNESWPHMHLESGDPLAFDDLPGGETRRTEPGNAIIDDYFDEYTNLINDDSVNKFQREEDETFEKTRDLKNKNIKKTDFTAELCDKLGRTHFPSKVAPKKTTYDGRSSATLMIDPSDWKSLRDSQVKPNTLPMEWVNVFGKKIHEVNNTCSFIFRRHFVTKKNSRKKVGNVFRAYAECGFSGCNVSCSIRIESETKLQAELIFSGTACHKKDELRARYVRGSEREMLKEKLQYKAPRREYLDNLKKLPDDVFESGCRDKVPSKQTLEKISSEGRSTLRGDENEVFELYKLLEQQKKKGTGRKIEGVLRKISLEPPFIMLWSEESVRVWHSICPRDVVYLDGTGSIVNNNSSLAGKRKYQLYELVVRNPVKRKQPFTVASILTAAFTADVLSYFISCFEQSEKTLYGHQNVSKPALLIIDGSSTLLLASLRAFTSETPQAFHERCFRIVTGKARASDFSKSLIHLCSSHFMKSMASFCRKYFAKSSKFMKYCVGSIITSHEWGHVKRIVRNIFILTGSKYFNQQSSDAYREICSFIYRKPEVDELDVVDDDELEDPEVIKENITEEFFVTTSPKSPFRLYFSKMLRIVMNNIDSTQVSGNKNRFYSPEFAQALIDNYLATVAAWSSLLLGNISRHGTTKCYTDLQTKYSDLDFGDFHDILTQNRTQGTIEKSMQEIKRVRLNSRRVNTLDEFVRIYERDNIAVQREFIDELSRKPRRVPKRATKIAQDKWGKKKKKSSTNYQGTYLSPPSKQFSSIGDNQEGLTRKMNLSSVSSVSKFSKGIENKNYVSCWFSVGMQLIRHVFELCKIEADSSAFTHDITLRSLCEVIQVLNSSSGSFLSNKEIYPGLTQSLREMNGDGRQQQDVGEFFSCVITRLFSKCSIDTKLQIEEKKLCMNLFDNLARTTDPPCSAPNSYSMSSVPLNLNKPSLQACFDDFFEDDYLEGYKCDKSGCQSNLLMTTKKIIKVPRFMILELKRYMPMEESGRRGFIVKDHNPIQFPQDLNITLNCEKTQKQYKIVCVVCHIGNTPSSGHYLSIHFHGDNKITKCNDENVTFTNFEDIRDLLNVSSYFVVLTLTQDDNTRPRDTADIKPNTATKKPSKLRISEDPSSMTNRTSDFDQRQHDTCSEKSYVFDRIDRPIISVTDDTTGKGNKNKLDKSTDDVYSLPYHFNLSIASKVWSASKFHSPFSRAAVLSREPIPWVDLIRILPETRSYFDQHRKLLYPNNIPGWLSDSFVESYNKAIVIKGNEVTTSGGGVWVSSFWDNRATVIRLEVHHVEKPKYIVFCKKRRSKQHHFCTD